jgi:exopolyphosphatase / guanosine-5'-triphosphate,3'-diphosphate pyrophosphatase
LKFAVVDIGSNAIRLQISNVLEYNKQVTFKKIEYVRFPLRLGNDVFSVRKINPINEAKFIKLMQSFKLLIELFEVDDYHICATSAMRESKNGHEIVNKVLEETGLKIHIIDGNKEAELINKAIAHTITEKTYLHIDVGGGSTELNLYVNKEKIAANSFKIGSVRRLSASDSPEVWQKMKQWVQENVKKKYGKVTAIGTGGNINKVFELAKEKKGKALPIKKLEEVKSFIESYTYEERLNILQLNNDRADVIIPASEIYLAVMSFANSDKILVPDVGLKDGMLQMLYDKTKKKQSKKSSPSPEKAL